VALDLFFLDEVVMALPLPRVVADVGPGGPLVTSMRGANALRNDILGNIIKSSEAEYAPVTTLANAMSKVAYSNLMQPQYLAKLFNNPSFVANMSPEELNQARQLIVGGGIGQSNYNNALMNLMQNQGKSNNSLSDWLVDRFKGMFGQGNEPVQSQNSIKQNPALQQFAAQYPEANKKMFDQYQKNGQAENFIIPSPSDSGYALDKNGKNITASPEEVERVVNEGNKSLNANQYFEKGGEAQGREIEKKELGKQRAKSITELDDSYNQALDASHPINHLIDIAKNPSFQNLRKYPGFQNFQMNMKANFGTPEEQELIGDFQVTATKAVAQAVNGFRGRILDKEIQMANKMKISPNDNINMIVGKLPSIYEFNEMIKQRSRLASKIMHDEHISKGDALEKADKMIDGNEIRKQVQDDLHKSSMITIRNKKTGEQKTISRSEARKLGVPNV
jgi:hypothetical protein